MNTGAHPADPRSAPVEARARPRVLAIRPEPTPEAHGGDEIVYRRSLDRLARTMSVETLHLHAVGKVRRVLGILGANPPETTRFLSDANRRRVAERLARGDVDIVLLCNEVTFPMLPVVKRAGVPAVLSAHNVHSIVAATDPTLLGRVLKPCATAFERRWYADSAAALILISQSDRAGLAASGIERGRLWVSPPGAPRDNLLADGAPLLPEAVLTGSYGWWRKRRDLESFRGDPTLGVPILASDPDALAILGDEAVDLRQRPDFSWSQGVRFGLITDSFLGGFKLKSLEYVANNCIILSRVDIRAEYAGLPHVEACVQVTPTKAAMADALRRTLAEPGSDTVPRFREFKHACLERYDWDRCLDPFEDAVRSALPASGSIAS